LTPTSFIVNDAIYLFHFTIYLAKFGAEVIALINYKSSCLNAC
jgi:hypothetical protein